jgi:hypothetical protein
MGGPDGITFWPVEKELSLQKNPIEVNLGLPKCEHRRSRGGNVLQNVRSIE